jgi:hypothetical protein
VIKQKKLIYVQTNHLKPPSLIPFYASSSAVICNNVHPTQLQYSVQLTYTREKMPFFCLFLIGSHLHFCSYNFFKRTKKKFNQWLDNDYQKREREWVKYWIFHQIQVSVVVAVVSLIRNEQTLIIIPDGVDFFVHCLYHSSRLFFFAISHTFFFVLLLFSSHRY